MLLIHQANWTLGTQNRFEVSTNLNLFVTSFQLKLFSSLPEIFYKIKKILLQLTKFFLFACYISTIPLSGVLKWQRMQREWRNIQQVKWGFSVYQLYPQRSKLQIIIASMRRMPYKDLYVSYVLNEIVVFNFSELSKTWSFQVYMKTKHQLCTKTQTITILITCKHLMIE